MDIVKRLRETYSATYAFTDIPHIGREAADEIERLRELLRMAAYPRRGTAEESMTLQEFADIVQSAYTIEQLDAQ